MKLEKSGRVKVDKGTSGLAAERVQASGGGRAAEPPDDAARKSTVAKVSHTLSVALAQRLEEFAFFQRISESAVIEHSLNDFFAQSNDDAALGETLRRGGAGRRRKA